MVSTATRTALALIVSMLLVFASSAQSSKKNDEVLQRAEKLFEEERFAEAYPLFSQLVSLQPNDPNVNFKFGATSLYAGVAKEKAIKHISFSLKKGCKDPRAYFYLGKAHHLNYDFAKAEDAYSKYLEKVSPKEKNPLPAQRNLQMCRQGGKLLSNIRDVVVLEKTEASESDFYRYFNLEEIGGRVLRTPDELLTKYDRKNNLVSVMHYPGDAVTIYFTSYGKDGSTGKDIYRASILPGGSYSTPERLPDIINTEFDEDFAFMHPDGKSFYFASRGHNSMGGYDIFKSTYDPVSDAFSKPENLDFAINTPDDDLFYVVDSLKQTAYFASGRSSAQGQLHVYKVMVQSKPVELMFIAGDYFPEAPGLDQKARITITDELTGRPVMETVADASKRGYLLELPKAGMYRMEVHPVGGAVKHSGVFNVPLFDRSVALAQELRIVNEDGVERLIITNSFEEPLDMNVAELAADALRRRSSLDVNVSEEALRELEELQDDPGSLRDDISLEELVVLAGFKSGTSPQDVVDGVAKRASEQREKASFLQVQAGALLSEAALASDEAASLLKEAQSSMESAEQEGSDAVARVTPQYNRMISEADAKAERTTQLKEAARLLHESSVEAFSEAEKYAAQADKLQTTFDNNNLQESQALLEEQYTRDQQNRNIELSAEVITADDLREADRLVNALTGRMEALEEERKDLQNRKTIVKRELEAASRKNQVTQLKIELESIENDLIAVDNEAYLKNQKLVDAYRNRRQLNLRQELIASAVNAEPSESLGSAPYSEDLLAQLDESTRQMNDRLDILRVDGGETFGLGASADERKDDAPNESFAQGDEVSDFEGVEWVAVNERVERWNDRKVNVENETFAALQQQVLAERQQQEALETQAELREKYNDASLSEDDRRLIESELNEVEEWINRLDHDVAEKPEFISASPEAVRERLNSQFPEVAQALIGDKGNDLDAIAKRLELFNEAEETINQEIEVLKDELVAASSSDEVERVAEEIIALKQLNDRLSTEALIDKTQIAWENDQRAIIEQDEGFVVRTERQIELAETYIETLEKLRLRAEKSDADSGLAAIDQEILKAKEKVNLQRSELELAVSVDDSARVLEAVEEEPIYDEVSILSDASDEQSQREVPLADNIEQDADEVSTEQRVDVTADTQIEALDTSEKEARIAQLVESIDAVEDDRERDQLQAELTALLKQATTEQPQERTEVSIIPPPVAAARTEVVLKELDTYEQLAETFPDIRSAERRIEDGDKALELLNSQGESATKRSEVKRLERQRSAAEKEAFEGRVDRALAAAPATAATYEEQQTLIAELWSSTQVNEEPRKRIGSHLATEQRRAEQSFEQAQKLRVEAKDRRSLEERSELLEKALIAEVEAITIQKRLLGIAEHAERLAAFDAEEIDQVLSGELRLEELELRDAYVQDVAKSRETEDLLLIDSTTDQQQPEIRGDEPTETTDTALNAELAEDKRDEREDLESPTVLNDSATEEAEVSASIIANARANAGMPEVWPELAEPELAEMSMLNDDEEEALLPLLRERDAVLDARAAVVRSVEQTQQQIALVEEAIREADSVAEQEGLAEELSALYRTAEVRYNELADYDEQLMMAEDQLVVRAAEVRIELASVARDMEQSQPEEDLVTLTENDFSSSGEPVAETMPEPVMRAAGEERSARAAKTDVVDYLFELPEVMVESVFEVLDEDVYTEEAPIPIDVSMPEGIIYKVQVGAFRNPIAPATFDRFAPLAGERLDNGITRYTAGVFVAFSSADDAKQRIREMGYSDAFVVAYRNGKRVSISEARNDESAGGLLATSAEAPAIAEEFERSTEQPLREKETAAELDLAEESSELEVDLPAFAERWNSSKGAWLTVQIGVYSKPVTLADLYSVSNVIAEVLDGGLVRYTTGKYNGLEVASEARQQARNAGINDAFVTAYIDGRRVSLAEYRSYTQNQTETPEASTSMFRVQIGGFSGKVPAETARALLLLEAKWGVFQRESDGETFYYTRTLSSQEEADRAANEFKLRGASEVEVVVE